MLRAWCSAQLKFRSWGQRTATDPAASPPIIATATRATRPELSWAATALTRAFADIVDQNDSDDAFYDRRRPCARQILLVAY